MDAIKLPFNFDINKLSKAYNSIPKSSYYKISNPSVTPDTLDAIHLITPIANKGHDFSPNATLKNLPYLLEILNTFECKKETFRIHTLQAGAKIKAHRDTNLNYENGSLRLHIPIITNPNIKMIVANKEIIMKPGECWYLDFNKTHEVMNNSNEDRVHLIIDCLSNSWWDDIMKKFGKSKDHYERPMTADELASYKHQLSLLDSDIAEGILKTLND